MRWWRHAPWLLPAAGLVLCLVEGIAQARPGGGHSYSGGGSGGGGGDGGGGGGALVELLFYLIIYKPQIGIPVAIIFGVLVWYAKRNNDGLGDWDSGQSIASVEPAPDLEPIRALDSGFSEVLFSDFVYALYAQAHKARPDAKEMAALAPYLTPQAQDALANRPPTGEPVSGVVVGAMRVMNANIPQVTVDDSGNPLAVTVSLFFESNMTIGAGDNWRTYYVKESWQLARAATTQSRPPQNTRDFGCPNCGAPFESSDGVSCSYCGEAVANGRFDWIVTAINLYEQEPRPPSLVSHARERGTKLETVHHPMFRERLAELSAADPSVNSDSLYARLLLIFDKLNEGWSALDLSVARPFVSDGMFNYLSYWIGAYHQQGLRNVTEKTRIYGWDLARVTRDSHYDSVVLRVWATGFDYTVDQKSGKVVGGSKIKERDFSEYWTLIRGAKVQSTPRDGKQCPNCGAALQISMGGNCEFCGVHVTAGEFDWVLSKIEQDEAYRG